MTDDVVKPTRNRIFKARVIGGGLGDSGDDIGANTEFPSKQLLEDPFIGLAGYSDGSIFTRPPYPLEQLVVLAEKHPVHGASLEQKAMDVVGKDVEYASLVDNPDDAQRDDLKAWLEELPENETFTEVLHSMQLDYHTTGWGLIEIARDIDGIVRRLYHVPSHTVRAHRDNKRLIQIRNARTVWFKRWGVGLEDTPVLAANGRRAPEGTNFDKLANEMIVFRKSSRRSTWYGVPNYVSAIGHIALAVAARDYNIKFFTNAREPRLVFVVSGLEGEDEEIDAFMDELEQSLKTQHNEPHRNLVIPLVGPNANLRIERLTAIQNDMHFTKLMEQTERDILIAHRMPPDRIGASLRGMLGGNVAMNINRIYKDAVVGPEQLVLKDRWNRFTRAEYTKAKGVGEGELQWELSFESLDMTDETADTMNVLTRVRSNAVTLNEARDLWGMDPRPDMDVTLAEWLETHGGKVAPDSEGRLSAMVGDLDTGMRLDGIARTQETMMARMEQFDEMVTELLLTGGDNERQVAQQSADAS
jgi:PBSX family phage portal protein